MAAPTGKIVDFVKTSYKFMGNKRLISAETIGNSSVIPQIACFAGLYAETGRTGHFPPVQTPN
jgi:hypothetical protein